VTDEAESAVVFDAAQELDYPELTRLEELLDSQRAVSAGNLWGSAQPFILAALSARRSTPLVAVTSTEIEAEALYEDLRAFGADPLYFPARESYASKAGGAHADAETIRARLDFAQRFTSHEGETPQLIVASVLALLQPVPRVKDLEREFLKLKVGDVLDPERLLAHLVEIGYSREPLAESAGEVSLRGDILDIFPFASEVPVRVELFEDEIESLRTFEPADQRSIETVKMLDICLAGDIGGIETGDGIQALSLLPHETTYVEIEPLRVEERAERLRIQSPAHERELRILLKTRAVLPRLDLQSLPGADITFETRSVQAFEVGMTQCAAALREALEAGTRVIVLCQTEAEEHRLRALIDEQGGAPGIETSLGSLSKGFRVPPLKLVLVGHHELKGVLGIRRRKSAKAVHRVKAIQSFFDLKKGDLVVHAVHGLSRYVGLKRVTRGGGEEEHLELRFAGDVSLYVPSSRIDMVQRYVGSNATGLKLDKIGGTTFRRRKEKVEKGLFDLAAEMIEVQAKRALRERPSWQADEELVNDMIGSFPYTDTVDQATVDVELTKDLYGPRPMDRLICGDVGFGKTELAVRAAFRVVNGGGQVAVLVPTTVLAEQHFRTFSERLADFPVEVAVVSRYVPRKELKETVEKTARGEVDILIGTHRILSRDVAFKDLGLCIIDEEQRFGVTHKEHFKRLRASVDMLTMTATPIPRTLHMSLSGIRDISALTVAPDGRQEIETILAYSDDEDMLRETILREKNRGGQVYFLHNRVTSIEAVAHRIQTLVPDCTYAIGHGQMSARELRAVMESFTSGDVDVLVATTIIENGLDIPTAGTILIDDADHFGLSELHQLRGRVGRGSHKAFCYLLVERFKPLHDIARERLKALEEMNHLGAGFGISVKDLELRGAGNVLGAQQSGHIAAVGYDMYCRLLKLTIERLQAGESFDKDAVRREEQDAGVELELGIAAYLPDTWVALEETRLELLRQMVMIDSIEDAERTEQMLRDRFGRVPEEASNLVRLFRLKALLDPHGLTRLAWRGTSYLVEYEDPVALERFFQEMGGAELDLRRVRRGVAHLMIPPSMEAAEEALDWFEGLLKAQLSANRMAAAGGT